MELLKFDPAAYSKPYIFSIQPVGTIPESAFPDPPSPSLVANGVLQAPTMTVQSSLTYKPVQSLVLPVDFAHTLRLLCSSPGSKAPLFITSSPTDRATAAAQGSSIWLVGMRSWSEQLDELVEEELYSDALTLLESLDAATVPDQASIQFLPI